MSKKLIPNVVSINLIQDDSPNSINDKLVEIYDNIYNNGCEIVKTSILNNGSRGYSFIEYRESKEFNKIIPRFIEIDLRQENGVLESLNETLLNIYNEIQDKNCKIIKTVMFGEESRGFSLIEYQEKTKEEKTKRLIPKVIEIDLIHDDGSLISINDSLLKNYNEIQKNGGSILRTTIFDKKTRGYVLIEYEI